MPEHNLEERIAAAADLAPAERRVAEFFAESGDQTSFLSAAKIAASIGVSTATVVRTAQRLGYSGLPELRDELQAAVLRRPTPTKRLMHSLDELSADLGALPANLFAMHGKLLEQAAHALPPADFVRAVELLDAADRIVVFSRPQYGWLGEHFAKQLRICGRRVQAIGVQDGQLAEELVDVGPGDVLLVVSYYQLSVEVETVLDRAREQQLPSVLVTDTLALALKDRYTVALSALRGELDMYQSAAVPIAILEALQFGISAHDRPRTIAAMAKREELRKRLS